MKLDWIASAINLQPEPFRAVLEFAEVESGSIGYLLEDARSYHLPEPVTPDHWGAWFRAEAERCEQIAATEDNPEIAHNYAELAVDCWIYGALLQSYGARALSVDFDTMQYVQLA